MARAFLPYMRERKKGTIVWIGSVGGYRLVRDESDRGIKGELADIPPVEGGA